VGEGRSRAEMRQDAHMVGGRGKRWPGSVSGFLRFAQQGLMAGRSTWAPVRRARQNVLAAHVQSGGANFGFQQWFGFLDTTRYPPAGEGAILSSGGGQLKPSLSTGALGRSRGRCMNAGPRWIKPMPGRCRECDVEVNGFAQSRNLRSRSCHQRQARLWRWRSHYPTLGIF